MRAYWSKLARVGYRSDTSSPPPDAKGSLGLQAAATVLRTIFIGTLVLITLTVSMPQNGTIWTAYDTPLDVVRLLLGLAVCIWLVVCSKDLGTHTAVELGSILGLPQSPSR